MQRSSLNTRFDSVRCAHKKTSPGGWFQCAWVALAVRAGFEPAVQSYPYGSLANYWFQPLTHLTGIQVKGG